jgi:hypothetical protein
MVAPTDAALRFDLSEVELSPETRALFPLRAGEVPRVEQRRFGTWWIAPFARIEGGDLLGFRLQPGVRLADGPVVWASGPAAVTVASRVDRVVPVVVFAQMLSAPRRWDEASELLDTEWDELAAAHRALGGTDLAVLRSIARDDKLRVACARPGLAAAVAAARTFERLDPSADCVRFRRALVATASGHPLPAVDIGGDTGPWAAARDALAFDPSVDLSLGPARVAPIRASFATAVHRDGSAAALSAAWRLFRHPAGLDVVWGHPADAWPEPVATEAAKRLHAAARLLTANVAAMPADGHADPLWPAITALAAAPSPFDYHGVEFIEAAAELDQRGAPERALTALTAVEFWNFLAGGEPMDGAIEAAHALAHRQGWAHLAAFAGALLGDSGDQTPAPPARTQD